MVGSNILIVEDEMIIAMEIRATLKKLGYTVVGSVINGFDAIQTAGEKRPDLVLMDIRLKGEMDGIEAAEKIMDKYDIPVIFLTGNSDKITVERAVKIKPAGFLVKPFKERELFGNIEMVLHKRKVMNKIDTQAMNQVAASGEKSAEDTNLELISKKISLLDDPIVVVDSTGKIIAVNKSIDSITDLPSDVLINKSFTDLVHCSVTEEDMDKNLYFALPDTMSIVSSGSEQKLNVNTGLILNEKKELLDYLFILESKSEKDVAWSKNAQDNHFVSMMDNFEEPIFIVDSRMNIFQYNQKFVALAERLGISKYKLKLPIYEISELSVFVKSDEYLEVFKMHTPYSKVKRVKTKGGKYNFFKISLYPDLEAGVSRYVTTVIKDITTIIMAQNHSHEIAETLTSIKAGLSSVNSSIQDINMPLMDIIKYSENRPQPVLQSINKFAKEIADLLEKFNIHRIEYENAMDKMSELDRGAQNWEL